MTNNSAPRVRYGTVLLSITVLIGCRGSGPGQDNDQAAINRLAQAAKNADQAVIEDNKKAFEDNQTLIQAQVRLLSARGPGFVDASTPLRVRGGAMTFRSDKTWKTPDGGNNTFCTFLGPITSVDLIEVSPSAANPISLGNAWTITLAARKSDGAVDSATGIKMTYPSTCDGHNDGILLETIGTPSPIYGFYDPTKGFGKVSEEQANGTHGMRFRHSFLTSADDCSKDEDACEHMGSIKIMNGSPSLCVNGECRLEFHP